MNGWNDRQMNQEMNEHVFSWDIHVVFCIHENLKQLQDVNIQQKIKLIAINKILTDSAHPVQLCDET